MYGSRTCAILRQSCNAHIRNDVQRTMSIVFDRAATYYDQTRGLPPEGERSLAAVLRAETSLQPGDRVLEIGVGTGRIALPLIRFNRYRYTGVDLSTEMMQVLRRKADTLPINLVRGDVARLPFADGTFDAVVAVHVFHLIGGWAQAMDEVRRVLRAGGRLLHGRNAFVQESPLEKLRQDMFDLAGAKGERREAGLLEWDDIRTELTQRFSEGREVVTQPWRVRRVPRQMIEQFERRIWSATWLATDDALARAAEQGRAWAGERFGGLDAPLDDEQQFTWTIYTTPA